MTATTDAPPQVLFGEITGYFVEFLADTTDTGNIPTELTLDGHVTLVPTVGILKYPTTDPPRTAVIARLVCPVIDGVLTAPDGISRLFVVATEQPDAVPAHVQWTATFAFDGVNPQPRPVTFNVPAGGVVDLTSVIPTPLEPNTILVVTTDSAAAADASADLAAAAALDAEASAETAELAAAEAMTAVDAAQDSANDAGASAGQAAASATTAGNAATAAGTSATGASGSATAAAGSATAAATSASAAAATAAEIITTVAPSADWTGPVTLTAAQSRNAYLVRRLTGPTTLTLAAGDTGKAYTCTLELTQDATGGRTLTVMGALTSYAIPFALTTAPNARDLVNLLWNGTTWLLLPAAMAVALPTGS